MILSLFGLTSSSLVTLFSPAISVAFASIARFSSSDRTGPFNVTWPFCVMIFHVVRVGRERFVLHDGLTNLLGDVAIGTVVLLLVGGGFVCVLVSSD